jgi:signal transduction histidine kinase
MVTRIKSSVQFETTEWVFMSKLASRSGATGLGLIGIQERLIALGGTLHIESEPGSGTHLHITIPGEYSNANSGRLS